MHTHTYTHTHTHTHTHTKHIQVNTYKLTHAHKHTHIHIQTHTQTHTHTYRSNFLLALVLQRLFYPLGGRKDIMTKGFFWWRPLGVKFKWILLKKVLSLDKSYSMTH